MTVAVAQGTTWWWWFAPGLVIAAVTTSRQALISLGKSDDVSWPLIDAKTRAGKIAAVAMHGSFALFFLIAVLVTI